MIAQVFCQAAQLHGIERHLAAINLFRFWTLGIYAFTRLAPLTMEQKALAVRLSIIHCETFLSCPDQRTFRLTVKPTVVPVSASAQRPAVHHLFTTDTIALLIFKHLEKVTWSK